MSIYLIHKITLILLSERECIISNNNLIKHNFFISYVLYKFYQYKREYIYTNYIIPIHRGILLHLKQNNLTYHYTGKNMTGKFLIKENIKREV